MNPQNSIAVLPFVNMSNDIDNEYFCDGITEEIINALTNIQQLKVIARTSSFAFKGKDIDIREIGKQLNVHTILEGSIKKSQEKIRITAQLIDVEEGIHFWSKRYDRELVNIFDLEDEISLAIADEVRNNFGHFEVQEHLVKQPTNNVEAYQLFLKGRSIQLKWTAESFKEAIDYYNQAIALDKNYAKAYYANLQCYGILGMWGFMPYEEAMNHAISNLLIAKEIDNTLPEYPLCFVGKFLWEEWDFKNAYIHIQQVLAINPNHIDGLEAMAELFILHGFFDEALVYAKKLIEVDPLSKNNHYTLAHLHYFKGQYKKALESLDYALTLHPEFELAHHLKSFCFIWLNQRANFEKHIANKPSLEEKKILFNLINDQQFEVPTSIIEKLIEQEQSSNVKSMIPYDIYILSNSNFKEKALSRLSNMIDQRRGQVINYRQDPFLKPLHQLNGFADLHTSNLTLSYISPSKGGKEKLGTHILDNQQVVALKKELQTYFTEEEPFLDTQLSLKFVADTMELNTNKISYLINKAFQLNFNDFVNSYRLKHFKTIALNPKNAHLTILALAYDSGFNSKSVFNTYFKKSEGITPKAWMKANM